jgi:membrane fusion protein, multidrug efflux system
MRKILWSIVGVALFIGAVLALVPEARQRAEMLTGLNLSALGGEPKSDAKAAPKRTGPPPVPVTTAVVVDTDMPIVLSAPGTVEALATVAIRSRVDGQIVTVGFTEGDLVKEGQMLFQLDDRLVKAQIQQAEANIAKDQASLTDAEAILGRREQLVRQKVTTEALLDTAKATVGALKASISSGKAALEVQKTQLDYLTIRAPLTARTGSLSGKLGSNVRAADATALVTLNQTKPIAVSFAMPQTDLTALRDALKRGAQAEIIVPGSKPVRTRGDLTFVDNQVDRSTGTVTAKVTSSNGEELLWPGLAVEIELTAEVKPKIPAVPSTAVLPAQQGMLAWVVGADNKVTPRPVTLERIVGSTAFVRDGLKAGERVVTDGQLRLAPGATITLTDPKGTPAEPKKAPSSAGGQPKAELDPAMPAADPSGATAKSAAPASKATSTVPGRS